MARPSVCKDGSKCAVGIQKLPDSIRPNFRENYIQRVIKLVFSSNTPWVNPSLDALQQGFDATFPSYRFQLHLDDAAVVLVCIMCLLLLRDVPYCCTVQTIRDIGILHCQIGQEAIKAVTQYLPSQYTKRQFNSASARAAYIQALISDKQYPFIWVCLRPGNIPVGGAKLYYDDVSWTILSSDHLLTTPLPETLWTIQIYHCAPGVLCILDCTWHSCTSHSIRPGGRKSPNWSVGDGGGGSEYHVPRQPRRLRF